MLNRLTPLLCSTFLADVIFLTLEFYGYAGVFFSQIIISPLIYINLLLKDAYSMTVYVIYFSERLHHGFEEPADRKRRGFKYSVRNFYLLRQYLPVVTKVTVVLK